MSQKQNKSSRELILDRINKVTGSRIDALPDTAYINKEIFKETDDLLATFINELEAVSGQCIVTESVAQTIELLAALLKEKGLPYFFVRDTRIAQQLSEAGIPVQSNPEFFNEMQAGITSCEYLIARTGSVLVSTALESGRQLHAFSPVHIILAHESQLLQFVEDGLFRLHKKYPESLPSAITLITGPSRTADIEKTLVMGAHGPKELIIFVERKKLQDSLKHE